MPGLSCIASLFVATVTGLIVGFLAGLTPGLHMNNIAAAATFYGSSLVALLGGLEFDQGASQAGVFVACFMCSAMMAHIFASSVTSTFIGIPSEDVVSVLPAHRLAKAGLGQTAVRASVDGAMTGVLVSIALFLPVCLLMGEPVHLYSLIREILIVPVIFFSLVLILSEGYPSLNIRFRDPHAITRMARAAIVFFTSGLFGSLVLMTDYCSSPVRDFQWIDLPVIPRSSLLLPMFAGLFGIPGLLLSLNSGTILDCNLDAETPQRGGMRLRDLALSALGGIIVGWLPGMTSGSAATICHPRLREFDSNSQVDESCRFIGTYSCITASGAVFSVGALFVISKARSGSMDAAAFFLGEDLLSSPWTSGFVPMLSLLLSILISAGLCYLIVVSLESRLVSARRVLCSRELALASLALVCSLVIYLTGIRGVLILVAASALGLLTPLNGVRRIQLMGCLLVPISLMLV